MADLERFWRKTLLGPLGVLQTLFHWTNSWHQNLQKCYHVGILEGIVHWLLTHTVKAQ
jgi:hypothetical protein